MSPARAGRREAGQEGAAILNDVHRTLLSKGRITAGASKRGSGRDT